MEIGLTTALSRIYSEISDDESKKKEERERKDAELQKKKELYDRLSELALKYAVSKPTSVGVGAGEGVTGYRLESTSHLVTPPVKVKTPQGIAEIQIIERLRGGSGYSVSHDGFSISNGDRILFHIRDNGDAVNWISRVATGEEIDFISREILDPLEKKLAELPKPKQPIGKRITGLRGFPPLP